MKKRDQSADADAEATAPEKPVPPRVPECTRYVQKRLAAQLPGIVDDLLEKSKKDAATLKALWQMGKLDEQEGTPRKRKGSLAREMLRER